ncbi:MAG: winged helix-turn-helix transcriptional regulator [Gemmatirosa sp.]|nr:winged helix-turn-helix transcriptional regulator [Gemmatirosa sp.]
MPDPSGTSDRRARDLSASLQALRRIVRQLRVANGGVEKSTGLSAAQLFVLEAVGAAPGASLSELAARTLTDRTSVAAVVDRLSARALVERRRSTTDRRRVELVLTDAGGALLAQAPHPPTRQILEGLGTLDDRQLRRLAVGLSRLVRGMGLAESPAVMLFEDAPGGTERGAPGAEDG